MKRTPYVLVAIVVIILLGAVALSLQNKAQTPNSGQDISKDDVEDVVATTTPAGDVFVPPVSTPNASKTLRVQSPVANQVLSSGFELKGEASGWYFEASFGASLLDANGKSIVSFPVTADGDWMTSDFVPFSEIVTFSQPETSTGFLVLNNDNPSGLPEHVRQFVIPVKFASSSTVTVKAYFSNTSLAGIQNTDCSKVYPVARLVPKTTSTGKAALEELLKGVAANEMGYATNIPKGVKLNSLTVSNGVAKADFNAALDAGVAGSCRVGAIRSQIEQTLKQFSSVSSVVISIDGKTDAILQP